VLNCNIRCTFNRRTRKGDHSGEVLKNQFPRLRHQGAFDLIFTFASGSLDRGSNNGIKVQFDVARPFPHLSPIAELQLLRIAQEALTNVRRHATATEVEVKLENTGEAVEMIVKDNGQGFILSDLEKAPPGYHGLNIIKERAEGLGGILTITTAPGEGTELRVSLPIEKVRL